MIVHVWAFSGQSVCLGHMTVARWHSVWSLGALFAGFHLIELFSNHCVIFPFQPHQVLIFIGIGAYVVEVAADVPSLKHLWADTARGDHLTFVVGGRFNPTVCSGLPSSKVISVVFKNLMVT